MTLTYLSHRASKIVYEYFGLNVYRITGTWFGIKNMQIGSLTFYFKSWDQKVRRLEVRFRVAAKSLWAGSK